MSSKSNHSKGKSGSGFILLLGAAYLISHSIPALLIGLAVGAGVGLVTSVAKHRLDTATRNRQDLERRKLEEERLKKEEAERMRREAATRVPLTGDEAADAVIIKGQEMLKTIRSENEMIPDTTLSAQMDALAEKCQQIFKTVSESPSKAPQIRKFMNYYLPTTLKMLTSYRTMLQRGVSHAEMAQARETAIRGMNMVLTACQKQLDNLHKETILDISTDIDVMEQMLKRDGYTENEITGNKGITVNARTAAEAQMRVSSAPVMDFPLEHEDPAAPANLRQEYSK